MKHLFILAQMFILSFVEGALLFGACAQNKTTSMNHTDVTKGNNEQSITMTQAPLAPEALAEEWDKTFPLSEKVNHEKVTFKTQYGFTLAAVDYLSMREDVDAEKIGIIGICGWGGIALNAAAVDPRIKATVAMTMYDMSRVNGNGYFII